MGYGVPKRASEKGGPVAAVILPFACAGVVDSLYNRICVDHSCLVARMEPHTEKEGSRP